MQHVGEALAEVGNPLIGLLERKLATLQVFGEGVCHESLGLALLIRVRPVPALGHICDLLLHLLVQHFSLFDLRKYIIRKSSIFTYDFNNLVLLLANRILRVCMPLFDLGKDSLFHFLQTLRVLSLRGFDTSATAPLGYIAHFIIEFTHAVLQAKKLLNSFIVKEIAFFHTVGSFGLRCHALADV